MPVWPICFWSCWPMPALAAIRFPAARIPMSFMVTPASDRAPRAASAARSTVSLSRCLPNLVMWIPRIQTFSAISLLQWKGALGGLVAEADRLHAVVIGAQRIRGQPDTHPGRDRLGCRVDVDQV